MKLIWLSDLHLEFLTEKPIREFLGGLAEEKPDAVLITGDISTAARIAYHLTLLADSLSQPIYFVLGNHDFYLGAFAQVDALVRDARSVHPNLIELGHGEVIPLSNDTALIGHRGWADGRAGIGSRSAVRLNDHQYISDLREPDPQLLFAILNRLGDESADYIYATGKKALESSKHLVVATHVPPFPEAALYQNKPSEGSYAPHFVNLALGRSLLKLAQNHPDKTITVLCGHTHHRALYTSTSNLKVQVAGAEYKNPQIASVLNYHARIPQATRNE